MIQNPLSDIAIINALRSDKVFYALIEELAWQSDRQYLKRHEALKDAIRDFYPSKFRKDALERVFDNVRDDPMPMLDALYDEYLANGRDGSYVFAAIEKLERYSALIQKIHPFNILGKQLAYELYQNRCDLAEIDTMAAVITPLLLGTRRESRDYSDNHIHLGGANENLSNLLILFERETPAQYYNDDWNKALPRLSEFSLINSGVLSIGQLVDIGKVAIRYLEDFILSPARTDPDVCCIPKRILDYGLPVAKFLSPARSFDFLSSCPNTLEGQLLKKAALAAKDDRRIAQWFYYNVLLHWLYIAYPDNKIVKTLVLAIFHITNIIRSYQTMSQNTGLSHFSEFYRSDIRQTREDRHLAIAENIFRNGTTMVEAKISPRQIYNGGMLRYKLAFDHEILRMECQNRTGYAHYFIDTLDPSIRRKYHFSIHFQRKDENNNRSADQEGIPREPRHASLRESLKNEAKQLYDHLYLRHTRQLLYDAYRPLNQHNQLLNNYRQKLQSRYIDTANMIVSLDVAGRETAAPPEVFAPAINFLRSEPKRYGYRTNALRNPAYDVPHRRLRLSVHAGEDFDHIATGMRRIDETIEFYGMQAHDRLGHALAVGIPPQQWLERNGDVFMRKIDRLDDLVWLHKQATKILEYFPEANAFIHRNSYFIEQLSREIYGEPIPPEQFYEACKLRKYCPIEFFSNLRQRADPYFRSAVPQNQIKDDEEPYKLFKKYHRNPHVRSHGEATLRLVSTANLSARNYWESDAFEMKVLHAVQDWLLEKIAHLGIFIEANPSSNVAIAQLNGFGEHPIFRWDPVNGFDEAEQKRYNPFNIRKGKVKVCINTDDPAIFSTTLFSEFKHLKRAAVDELGYHRPSVEIWLKNIREFGNEIFEYDHQAFESTVSH